MNNRGKTLKTQEPLVMFRICDIDSERHFFHSQSADTLIIGMQSGKARRNGSMVHKKRNRQMAILSLLASAFLALMLFASCQTTPAQKEASLTELVKSGDLNAIKKYYSNQEQLNMKDADGLYPLHHAVKRGDPQIAEILIVLGAKTDVLDPAGKTPLRYAIDRKQTTMARMLVDRGASLFIADAAGKTSAEAALSAGPEMISAVFSAKNINESGADGRTALHMASDRLMANEVSLLLDMGASVQTKDKAERTALDLALQHPEDKRAAIIAEKLILKGANPSLPAFSDFTWFVTTVRSSDYRTVRLNNGNTPLHEAVRLFQLGFVDFLLSREVDPNKKNLSGDAPLHIAVRTGWYDGAELLLKNLADPDIRDAQERTPLHLQSPVTVRLQMTKLLLKYKADPNLKDNQGNTPLHLAVKNSYEPAVIEEFLAANASVNAANLDGDTPLMLCVRAGTYQYASALIQYGADIFLKNNSNESSLSMAVARGTDAVDKIVLASNVLQRDNSGNSVILTAVALKGSPEVVSLLLQKGADPNVKNNVGDNALHVAVRNNLANQGTLLINAKTDIFAINAASETPVFLALAAKDGPYDWFFTPSVISARDVNGDTAAHHAARKNLDKGLGYLKGRGADMTAVNTTKETLLHVAAKSNAVDALRYLINEKANMEARDNNGDTPLQASVLADSLSCMQLLIASGADLNARNFSGESVLHQAVRKHNLAITQYLLEKGSGLENRDDHGQTALSVAAREAQADIARVLLTAGAMVDARDYSGSTPLYYGVETSNLALIGVLVKANADILAKNSANDSPLLAAMKKGPSVIRELLSGPTKDRADSEGKTPLRILVEARASLDTLNLVLSGGADPNSKDKLAVTPLHAALRQKDFQTAGLLLAAKADPFAPDSSGEIPIKLVLKDPVALKDFVMTAGINAADIRNEGFLFYAVKAGDRDAVQVLLDLGIDKARRNISGETAFDIANAKGLTEIAAILQ